MTTLPSSPEQSTASTDEEIQNDRNIPATPKVSPYIILCDLEQLYKAVCTCMHAISTRSTLPILGMICLTREESRLVLQATNLEITVKVWIPLPHKDVTRSYCLEAKPFYSFLHTMMKSRSSRSTRFSITEEIEKNLIVDCGEKRKYFPYSDTEEFPKMTTTLDIFESPPDDHLILPLSHLHKIIDLVNFNAADDESRPVFTGMNFRRYNDYSTNRSFLEVQAANSFSLARYVATLGHYLFKKDNLPDILIPELTMKKIKKIFPLIAEIHTIHAFYHPQRNQMFFIDYEARTVLVTRLIEGTFPKTEHLLCIEQSAKIILPTQKLFDALSMLKEPAKDRGWTVTLSLRSLEKTHEQILLLSVLGEEKMDQSITLLHGKKVTHDTVMPRECIVRLNWVFLMNIITALKERKVASLCLSLDQEGPSKIIPDGYMSGDLELLYLVMRMSSERDGLMYSEISKKMDDFLCTQNLERFLPPVISTPLEEESQQPIQEESEVEEIPLSVS